jgi:ketosteroid isomerase-like protein
VSHENVEIVKRAWQAFAERGLAAVENMDFYAESCVLEDIADLPDGRSYVGPAGAIERTENFAETWDEFTMVPVEYLDAGPNTVVVVTHVTGSAVGTGLPLDTPAVFAYEMRDGRCVRDRAFLSREQALKAVRLEK